MQPNVDPVRTERFLRLPQVLDRVPVSRSTLWGWVRQGRFPRPIILGPNATAWRATDVDRWIADRAAAADAVRVAV
jgi:prophage regulatory protein